MAVRKLNRSNGLIVAVAGLAGVSVFAAVAAVFLLAAAPFVERYESLVLFYAVVLVAAVAGLFAARYAIVRIRDDLRYARMAQEKLELALALIGSSRALEGRERDEVIRLLKEALQMIRKRGLSRDTDASPPAR